MGPLRGIAWTLAFSEMAEDREIIDRQGRGNPEDAVGILLSWYVSRPGLGRLSPAGLTLWRFGQQHTVEIGQTVEIGRPTGVTEPAMLEMHRRHKAALGSMLAFIQQQIVMPSRPFRPDRATRKIAERERPERTPVLRVIELRRRQRVGYQPPAESRTVDWKWQWFVRPFWRNQFYPSLNIHQPKRIAGYWKGPEDRPPKDLPPDIYLVDR
jgi:hypothetical protein